MRKDHIKYQEGQWFAVPLPAGGNALGLIVRGSYKTRGGLGYFFGPRFEGIPEDTLTCSLQPADAILITWFGDLGIIEGRWPLIDTTRAFNRSDWPVPIFGRLDALDPAHGWMTEYDQEDDGTGAVIREVRCRAENLVNLPRDVDSGADAVGIRLSQLLS